MKNLKKFEQFVAEDCGSGDCVACSCDKTKKKKKRVKKVQNKWTEGLAEGFRIKPDYFKCGECGYIDERELYQGIFSKSLKCPICKSRNVEIESNERPDFNPTPQNRPIIEEGCGCNKKKKIRFKKRISKKDISLNED